MSSDRIPTAPMFKLVNLIHYQAGWFACVLGAAHGIPWLGPGVVALFVAVDLALASEPLRQAIFIIAAGGLGFVVDSSQAWLGAFSFTGQLQYPWLCPPWMVALWMIFATLFHSALSWLQGRYVLGAIFGVVGGPLAYYAGAALGPITLSSRMTFGLGIIALAWGLATPLLLWIYERLGSMLMKPVSRT